MSVNNRFPESMIKHLFERINNPGVRKDSYFSNPVDWRYSIINKIFKKITSVHNFQEPQELKCITVSFMSLTTFIIHIFTLTLTF